MRHLKRGRHLGRTSSHKRAMLRNLAASLFAHGRVMTTPAKAKEARPFAERLITLARSGSLHDRRRALSLLQNKAMVHDLFEEIGPRYKDRPGGYTRILHLSKTRIGDSAPQVIFELVEAEAAKNDTTKPAAVVAETDTSTPTGDADSAAEVKAEEGDSAEAEKTTEVTDEVIAADESAEVSASTNETAGGEEVANSDDAAPTEEGESAAEDKDSTENKE